MLKVCQLLIPLQSDEKGRLQSNTYCMRPAGHEGKCAIVATDEDRKKQAAEATETK